jgi:hypothetical protein
VGGPIQDHVLDGFGHRPPLQRRHSDFLCKAGGRDRCDQIVTGSRGGKEDDLWIAISAENHVLSLDTEGRLTNLARWTIEC